MTPEELSQRTERELDELALKHGKALSSQHRILVERISEGASQTKACRDAGYSEKSARSTASRILRRKDVTTYGNILREQARRVAGVTREWMIRQHIEAAEQAKDRGDASGFKGCMQEVGKLLDFYPAAKTESKVEHTGTVHVNTNYQSEEVLRELMAIRRDEKARDTQVH